MTKEQFDKICQELRKRGYRRNFRNDETLRGDGWNYYYKVPCKAISAHQLFQLICFLNPYLSPLFNRQRI